RFDVYAVGGGPTAGDAIVGNDVGGTAADAADDVIGAANLDTTASVAQRLAGHGRADEVAIDAIARTIQCNAAVEVPGDDVARAGVQTANQRGRGGHVDGYRAIGVADSTRAGAIGADEIALDDIVGSESLEDFDAGRALPGNDIARSGIPPADTVAQSL